MKKRNAIASAVASRACKFSHKHDIESPSIVDNMNTIDKNNSSVFWRDETEKETRDIRVAFEVLEKGYDAPKNYKQSIGHVIFDVKIEFERKACWVLDDHKTALPVGPTHAKVASIDSARISFTHNALNGIYVLMDT